MTTPRKNFNYNSPYAKPVQQYPSQSEDYISFDMGGSIKNNNAASSSNEKTPGRYNPKYYQQNIRNSNSKANRKNLFNNSFSQQNNRQSLNQQQRYGQNQQNLRNSNEKRSPQQQNYRHGKLVSNSIADYCHPSMTEDPWYELMQRIQALEKSKISNKQITPTKIQTPTSGTCSDSDQNIDEEVDSTASD